MKRPKEFFIKLVYILIDIACGLLSIYLAAWLRKETFAFSIHPHNIFVNELTLGFQNHLSLSRHNLSRVYINESSH